MSLVAYASSGDESEDEEIVSPAPKQRETVKITIPSLKEFKDDPLDGPDKEPKKLKPKGVSGLIGLLPPPKNSSLSSKPGFTPYVFSKKKETKTTSIQHQKTVTAAKVPSEVKNSLTKDPENSPEKMNFFSLEQRPTEQNALTDTTEDKEDYSSKSPEKTDFFFLKENLKSKNIISDSIQDSNSALSNLTMPTAAEQNLPEAMPGYSGLEGGDTNINWNSNNSFDESAMPVAENSDVNWNTVCNDNSAKPNLEADLLKDERFLKLKGRKGLEEIKFIDVKADDQLIGKDELILQNLSREKVQLPSKRKHGMPTQQQRRKHQITYLAYQAKERELDLKNQWAHNSLTKRETQAKYGF